MKFGVSVKQSQAFNRNYYQDNWCSICDFMEFWTFRIEAVVALTFVKLNPEITHKYDISIKDLWYKICSKPIHGYKVFEIFENLL